VKTDQRRDWLEVAASDYFKRISAFGNMTAPKPEPSMADRVWWLFLRRHG